MDMENRFQLEIAQENFWKRVDKNKKVPKINNASLVAGSPMYFYCRYCGEQTDVLPEDYLVKPKTICEPCSHLERTGSIPTERKVQDPDINNPSGDRTPDSLCEIQRESP